MEREFLSPGLVHCEWSILGGFNNKYNCLAWAVGMQNVWVEGVYLENNVSTAESEPRKNGTGTNYIGIDAKYGNGDGKLDDNEIDNFFLDYGYVPVASVEDADIIYYDGYHAAKRRNCGCGEGRWEMFESKCGAYFTIEHVYDKISNYGAPARYYRKQ